MAAIGFGMAGLLPLIENGKPFEMTYSLSENSWNGVSSLQCMIRDIKKS
jgi:single-stranded-DNA-specific exonuclease